MIRKVPYIVRILTFIAGMPLGRNGKLNWKQLITESGLKVVSIHEDLGSILNNPQKIIGEAMTYRTNCVVVTGMHRFDYSNKQAVLELADKLNRDREILKEGGIYLLYHNHNCEFRKVE